MNFDARHHRRSIRLKNYDYRTPGAYFVTICTTNRSYIFGEIDGSEMMLNKCGQLVQNCWNELPSHYSHILLDTFVIMPNHIHGIVILLESRGDRPTTRNTTVGAGLNPAPTTTERLSETSFSEIVRGFKALSARRINEMRGTQGRDVWQRNYYEHIIRHERELNAVRQYIENNPAAWDFDQDNIASGR